MRMCRLRALESIGQPTAVGPASGSRRAPATGSESALITMRRARKRERFTMEWQPAPSVLMIRRSASRWEALE